MVEGRKKELELSSDARVVCCHIIVCLWMRGTVLRASDVWRAFPFSPFSVEDKVVVLPPQALMFLTEKLSFWKVLEGMVERRDSPDGETWLLLLNAVDTAGALDKAVELMERSRAEGHGSEVRR